MNRLKKSKKAFFLQLPTDIQGWFIFFIGVLFWATFFALLKSDVKYEITQQTAQLSDDDVLLTYLQTPVGNSTNIADLIADVYSGTSDEKLKNEMNIILNSVYGRARPVCWGLSADENLIASEKCTGEVAEILDAQASIPLPDKQPLSIRLTIPGYKE